MNTTDPEGVGENMTANRTTDGHYSSSLRYLTLVCIPGTIMNLIEVFLFLSKSLRSRSSTMLAGIATCNWLACFAMLLRGSCYMVSPIEGLNCYKVNVVLLQVQYFVEPFAVWLIVWLAVERYIAVCNPMTRVFHRPKYIDAVVVSAMALGSLVCVVLSITNVSVPLDILLAISYATSTAAITALILPLVRTLRRRAPNMKRHDRSCASKSATKVVVIVALLFSLTLGIPSVIIYSLLSVYPSEPRPTSVRYCISVVDCIGILGFASPDSIAYFVYNRAYRKKFLATFCFKTPSDVNASVIMSNSLIKQHGSLELISRLEPWMEDEGIAV